MSDVSELTASIDEAMRHLECPCEKGGQSRLLALRLISAGWRKTGPTMPIEALEPVKEDAR